MRPASEPAATSADTTQRPLIVVAIAFSLIFAVLVVVIARGGRADPPSLRAAAITLDGAWRFHIGDEAGWAAPDADDSDWEAIDLTAVPGSHDDDVGLPDYVGGWMARGHPGYHGYAWYRRAVTVPSGSAAWDILGPTLVDSGYELYWNGQLLGGSGRLGANPRLVGTRPMRFALPGEVAGTSGTLAIRTYMPASSGVSADAGGMHTAPLLAPRPISDGLHRAQWERTIAGYIVDAIEPLMMFALIVLVITCGARSGQKGFLVFASIALAVAASRRLNNAIVAWTDLQDLTTYSWLASVMWAPTVAAWTMAWNRWCPRPLKTVDAAALVLAVAGLAGALTHAEPLITASKYGSIAVFIVIAVRILRGGPDRGLALATLVSIVAGLFGHELLDPIGVPGIWFPFGIGVSRTQYLYAITIPLLALLILRQLRPSERITG